MAWHPHNRKPIAGVSCPSSCYAARLFAAAVRFATNRSEQKRARGHEADAASMGRAALQIAVPHDCSCKLTLQELQPQLEGCKGLR